MAGNREKLIIEATDGPCRLDQFLANKLSESRNFYQKLIVAGSVRLNEKECSARDKVCRGDKVVIELPSLKRKALFQPRPLPLNILHEDSHLLVVNKSAGVVVHPGVGTDETTLIEGVWHHLGRRFSGDLRPGIVHRLDKDTSGVMVIAKSDAAASGLKAQFQERVIYREYWALMAGLFEKPQTSVETWHQRDPRQRLRFRSIPFDCSADESGLRRAESTFRGLRSFGNAVTLASIRLKTGRTHQIRAHARFLGKPVLGDSLYDGPEKLVFSQNGNIQHISLPRQFLHARSLGFAHPITGKKIAFESAIPLDFGTIIEQLNKNRSSLSFC